MGRKRRGGTESRGFVFRRIALIYMVEEKYFTCYTFVENSTNTIEKCWCHACDVCVVKHTQENYQSIIDTCAN